MFATPGGSISGPVAHHRLPGGRGFRTVPSWPPMARPSKVPKPLQPMLATLIDAPFDNRDWIFETKWDGFRMIAAIKNGGVTLYSRSGLIVSANYEPIAKALQRIKHDAVLDGELVAFDAKGIS